MSLGVGIDNLVCRCWAAGRPGADIPKLIGAARLRAGSGVSPSQICANLDTEKIMSAQEEVQHLQRHVPQPRKQYDLCQERAQVRGSWLEPQGCSLGGRPDPRALLSRWAVSLHLLSSGQHEEPVDPEPWCRGILQPPGSCRAKIP